jgi:hypothetical protein
VAHGDQDTVVLVVLVEDARRLVQRLHSLRFEAVVDGIEAFAAWVRSRQRAQQA